MSNNELLEIIRKSAIAHMQDSFWFVGQTTVTFLIRNQIRVCASKADYCFSILSCMEYSLNNGYNVPYTIADLLVRDFVHDDIMISHDLYNRLSVAV